MTSPSPIKKLSDVARIYGGNSAPQAQSSFTNEGIPFIRTSDVGQVGIGEVAESRDRLTESAAKGFRRFPANSVLIPKSGASTFLNHRVQTKVEATISSHLAGIVPNAELDHEYLFYFMQTVLAQELVQDVSYPSLNLTQISNIEIPFPELEVQRRIGASLKSSLMLVSELKRNILKSISELDDLWQRVLSETFLGLGHEQPLSKLAGFLGDGDWIESKDQASNGLRLLQTGNVGIGKYLEKAGKERYISEETFERLRCTEIFEGDILVSRLPEPLGRSCILPRLDKRAITGVDCAILRLSEAVDPQFFVYFSQSPEYLQSVIDQATGTTRTRISRTRLGQIRIPVLPKNEQSIIIKKLDSISMMISTQKTGFTEALSELRLLRQAILTEAFQGV